MMNKLENGLGQLKKQIELYVKMDGADWQQLEPHCNIVEYKKYQCFATEGKKSNDVAMVLHGMFRQYYTKDGEEKTTYFYFEQHFMSSYISCITQQPSPLTIEALSDAVCIVFPYREMAALFEKSMAWQKFGRLVAEYLAAGLEERMVSLLLQSPEERYLDLLNSNKKKITERIPHHYIANYLGITPVSLSRIRNRIIQKKK
jgi:CRP-like cAMP-binding protein